VRSVSSDAGAAGLLAFTYICPSGPALVIGGTLEEPMEGLTKLEAGLLNDAFDKVAEDIRQAIIELDRNPVTSENAHEATGFMVDAAEDLMALRARLGVPAK
jgi:hypothetical protein